MPDKVNISQPVTSIGGQQFIQFAMSPTELGDDVYLYEQLVEPVLQSGDSPIPRLARERYDYISSFVCASTHSPCLKENAAHAIRALVEAIAWTRMYFPLFTGLPHMTIVTTPAPQPTHVQFRGLVVFLYSTWDVSVGMSPYGRKGRGILRGALHFYRTSGSGSPCVPGRAPRRNLDRAARVPQLLCAPASHLAPRCVTAKLQCFTQMHPRDCAHSVIIKQ